MSEQNVEAPEQVRKFAPKRNPRSPNRHPTDQAGEALVGMLHEAARASNENTGRVMELVHDLTQQLQATEERIGQLERDIDHFRARATGAEKWLERIEQEIQQNLISPMSAKQN
jgi:ABC-type transporter Mla subunit MlaD